MLLWYTASCPDNVFWHVLRLIRLPVQIFEAVFEFVLFAVLLVDEKRRPQTDILKVYLLAYAVFRFAIEFFRGDVVRGIFLAYLRHNGYRWGLQCITCYSPSKREKRWL